MHAARGASPPLRPEALNPARWLGRGGVDRRVPGLEGAWREAGLQNHLDDKVDSTQEVVMTDVSLSRGGRSSSHMPNTPLAFGYGLGFMLSSMVSDFER